jgi:hypothetical protein
MGSFEEDFNDDVTASVRAVIESIMCQHRPVKTSVELTVDDFGGKFRLPQIYWGCLQLVKTGWLFPAPLWQEEKKSVLVQWEDDRYLLYS